MSKQHDSVIGGCVRESLIAEAKAAGRKCRNVVRRGDVSADVVFDYSGVGYPFMTAAEHTAAKAAFVKAAR